ncbi:MAG: helix-turn-helix transcriptional regulator [Pseudobutyrivibrio sp.]|nr:helix-turn-helix transcriptional regulator [Pseudobutyrivibrio sp.]
MPETIIKKKREELGLSQSQFAEISGVNYRTLQDYEQGRKPLGSIKGEVLYRLSRALGCTMEDIISDSVSADDIEARKLAMAERQIAYAKLLMKQAEEMKSPRNKKKDK